MNVSVVVSNRDRDTVMKHKFILFFLLFITCCSTLHVGRLSGTYVSDKQATLEYLKNTGNYTPEHLNRIGKLLGKMKITYNRDNTAVVELNGDISQEKFTVTEVSSGHAVLEYNHCDRYEIKFDDDGYWLSGGIMPPPYMEKFKRIDTQ